MPKKRYTAEQIIRHLREAEVGLAKGQTTGEVCRKLGITEQTYYRWRKEYGSLRVDQVRRLKERASALPFCFFLCGSYLGDVGKWVEAEARGPDVQRFPRERPQGD